MTQDHSSHKPGPIRIYPALLFGAIVLIFLFLRTFLLPATPLLPHGDEVQYFAHGIRILHGQVPFRDFFIYVVPGADLVYSATFRLLGVHAWLAQGFIIFLGFTITCLVAWISRHFLSNRSAILAALLFLTLDFDSAMDATHHWYSTLFVLASISTLLGGRSISRILTASTLCGMAAVFTQTQGTLSLIAICIYLAIANRAQRNQPALLHQFAALLLPFMVIVTSVLAYYAHQAGFNVLFYDLGTFLFKYFSAEDAHNLSAYLLQIPSHDKLIDIIPVISYLFIHLLVPFVYLFALLRLIRERIQMDRRLWENILLITLVGLALFAAVMTAPTYLRMCMVAPPAVIIFVWFFSDNRPLGRSMRALLWSIATASLIFLPLSLQLHWRVYLDLPIGRTAILDERRLIEFLWFAEHTHAGESFFNEPLLSFAFSLENPTPLDVVTPTEYTRPEQVDAVISSLASHNASLIFLYPGIYQPRSVGDNLKPFRDYVYKNYHLAKAFPSGQVWERN